MLRLKAHEFNRLFLLILRSCLRKIIFIIIMQLKEATIATLILAAYFLFDLLLWEQIFKVSNLFAQAMQSLNNHSLEAIFRILTFFGYGTAFGFIYLLLWLKASNKIEVIKIISMSTLCVYIMGVLKIIYSQPRPYFVDPLIQAKDCDLGFGNPSGHALTTITVFSILFNTITFKKYRVITETNTLQFINRDNENLSLKFAKKQSQQELYEQFYPQAFLTLNQSRLLAGLIIFAIGISRVYLGAHSLNQIFLGWAIGGYLLFIYYEFLEDILDDYIRKAIYKKFDNKIHYLKLLIICCAIYGISTMIALLAFFTKHSNENESEWLLQIKQKCSVEESDPLLKEKCLMDSGVIVLPIMIFFCLLNSTGSYLPSTFPSYIAIHLQAFRLLVLILVLAIPAAIILLIIHFTPIKSIFLLSYFIQCHLLLGLLGFSLIIVVPLAYQKFKLDVTGDLMRKRQGSLDGQFTNQEVEVEL